MPNSLGHRPIFVTVCFALVATFCLFLLEINLDLGLLVSRSLGLLVPWPLGVLVYWSLSLLVSGSLLSCAIWSLGRFVDGEVLPSPQTCVGPDIQLDKLARTTDEILGLRAALAGVHDSSERAIRIARRYNPPAHIMR